MDEDSRKTALITKKKTEETSWLAGDQIEDATKKSKEEGYRSQLNILSRKSSIDDVVLELQIHNSFKESLTEKNWMESQVRNNI